MTYIMSIVDILVNKSLSLYRQHDIYYELLFVSRIGILYSIELVKVRAVKIIPQWF